MINLFCFTSFLANRKTIKLLFPEEAEERQQVQEFFPDYKSLIVKFESLNIKHQRQSSVSEGAQLVHHQHFGFNLPKIIFVTVSIFGIAIVSKASSKKKDEVLCKSHLGFKKILVSSGLSCPPNLGEK